MGDPHRHGPSMGSSRAGPNDQTSDETRQDEERQDEAHSDDALGAFRFTFLKQKIDKCARTGIYINIYTLNVCARVCVSCT